MRGALVVLLAVFPAAAVAADLPPPVLEAGSSAPDFTLPAYNPQSVGRPVVSLGAMVGSDAESKEVKAVLVSFMASWCKPCEKELPFLQQIAGELKDQGLRVLVISIDKEEEEQAKIRALIEKHKITVPVLKDRFNFVARRWLGEKSPLPSVFIVDPAGKIAVASAGYTEDATAFLRKEVDRVLAGGAAVARETP